MPRKVIWSSFIWVGHASADGREIRKHLWSYLQLLNTIRRSESMTCIRFSLPDSLWAKGRPRKSCRLQLADISVNPEFGFIVKKTQKQLKLVILATACYYNSTISQFFSLHSAHLMSVCDHLCHLHLAGKKNGSDAKQPKNTFVKIKPATILGRSVWKWYQESGTITIALW